MWNESTPIVGTCCNCGSWYGGWPSSPVPLVGQGAIGQGQGQGIPMPSWPPPIDMAKKQYDGYIVAESKARDTAKDADNAKLWQAGAVAWRAAESAAKSAAMYTSAYPEFEKNAVIFAATRAIAYAKLAAKDEALSAGILITPNGVHFFTPDGAPAGQAPEVPPAPTDVSPWYWVAGGVVALVLVRALLKG